MSLRRFPVPTHLAVEPAVLRLGIGLTLRQFICLAVGCGFAYLAIKRLHLGGPGLLLAATVVALALTIAFVQVGGRPVERWLRDRLTFHTAPRVRLWQPQAEARPPLPAGAWATRPLRVTWALLPARERTSPGSEERQEDRSDVLPIPDE
jgi:hypothetical protein